MCTFGILARNYAASNGPLYEDHSTRKTYMLTPYEKFLADCHLCRMPCPGSCSASICVNTFCKAHPGHLSSKALDATEPKP